MAGTREGMKFPDISVLVGVSYRLCYDEVIQHCVKMYSVSRKKETIMLLVISP